MTLFVYIISTVVLASFCGFVWYKLGSILDRRFLSRPWINALSQLILGIAVGLSYTAIFDTFILNPMIQ